MKKHIHFVGIKGVGMTPLAVIAKQAGCMVTGSDIAAAFITDATLLEAGIVSLIGFVKEHVTDADLVITTGAHGGFANPEVMAAKEQGIKVLTQGEAVGVFMHGAIFGRTDLEGIAIAGTHGKTTTTAMLATIFMQAKLDPSYVIGTSVIPSLPSSGHYGKGKYFIAEADEYATEPTQDKTAKFLWQHPKTLVITNIDYDHPDIYASLEESMEAFTKFVTQLPENGLLILCGDDPNAKHMKDTTAVRTITYGCNADNDYVISDIAYTTEGMQFLVSGPESLRELLTLHVPGKHNAMNVTAALIVAREKGVVTPLIKTAVREYLGSKRRFEYKGKLRSGTLLFDDYAHHPTEIKTTLEAARKQFPDKKIFCFFQPHTYSRTKEFFSDFANAFTAADSVIVTSIYASLREQPDPSVSAEKLAEMIKQNGKEVIFLPTISDMVEYIDKEHQQQHIQGNTVLITMGAGDIYTLADSLDLLHE